MVDYPQDPGREEPFPEAAPITDHRVVQRDEWVEHERTAPCDPSCPRHVEVPRVAGEHRVERIHGAEAKPHLRDEEPERGLPASTPVVALPVPDALVPLH